MQSRWVPSHSEAPGNQRADSLAKKGPQGHPRNERPPSTRPCVRPNAPPVTPKLAAFLRRAVCRALKPRLCFGLVAPGAPVSLTEPRGYGPWRQSELGRTAGCRGGEGWSVPRHATSVWQGNWFSVGIGPVSMATQ